MVDSDSLRKYHEIRTRQSDEALRVQLDDQGDEYEELLGMLEENEPGEEEKLERARRAQVREPAMHGCRAPGTLGLEVTGR